MTKFHVELEVGARVNGPKFAMTRERMRWYCDALETAAAGTGEFIIAEPTIHTDDEYARSQGLPGIIADGMLSTNYISALLFQHFGMGYLERGALRTKFIRPVYENEVVEPYFEVRAIHPEVDRECVTLDVGCTANGELCTVGEAEVFVDSRMIREEAGAR